MALFAGSANRKAVLGMIHLQPLPGTPYYQEDSLPGIVQTAVDSALALERGGATGCLVQADPLRVMEYRQKINATGVKIVAEVDSMHFSWFGGASVAQVARQARYAGADAVSLAHPDEATTLEMIAAVREAVPGTPIILAGHTDHDNAARLLAAADGAFVGTCLENGGWGGRIDVDKVRAYTGIVAALER